MACASASGFDVHFYPAPVGLPVNVVRQFDGDWRTNRDQNWTSGPLVHDQDLSQNLPMFRRANNAHVFLLFTLAAALADFYCSHSHCGKATSSPPTHRSPVQQTLSLGPPEKNPVRRGRIFTYYQESVLPLLSASCAS